MGMHLELPSDLQQEEEEEEQPNANANGDGEDMDMGTGGNTTQQLQGGGANLSEQNIPPTTALWRRCNVM